MRLKLFSWLVCFMQNSKSKIKSALKWAGWILGFIAKFLPSSLKTWALALSTLSGGVVALLDSCDKPKSPSDPIPQPTVIVTATPSPTPIPTPKPKPQLKAPKNVKSQEPFWVELCGIKNTYNVDLYVGSYRLGYMGFGKPCMRLNVRLHDRGKRTLIAIADGKKYQTDIIIE